MATITSDVNDGRHVPLIDYTQSDELAAQDLHKALSTVGFACFTGTGLWDMVQDYNDGTKPFFHLPLEEKMKYKRPASGEGDNGGWVAIGREALSSERPGDYKECINIMYRNKGNMERHHKFIDNPKCWELWDKMAEVSNRVNHLIGIGLGLKDPHFIEKTHNYSNIEQNNSAMRINWYPKVDKSMLKPGQIRCGEHSDYGSITLLYSNAPGLQVLNRTTGEFMDAGHVEGGIFVNLGDLLQMWSGDQIIANKHRVLIPDEKYLDTERMSLVFFAQPDNDVQIETLDGSAKYPTITSGQWLTERFAATYDVKH